MRPFVISPNSLLSLHDLPFYRLHSVLTTLGFLFFLIYQTYFHLGNFALPFPPLGKASPQTSTLLHTLYSDPNFQPLCPSPSTLSKTDIPWWLSW